MMRLRVTCCSGHSTVIAADMVGDKYRSVEDADWQRRCGDGPPVRCPFGADTEDVEVVTAANGRGMRS